MRLWETDAAVAPLTFHPKLAQAAAELLGVPAVRLWQDQALFKQPGGRITDAHQDAPFWPIGNCPLITAWIPLNGSSMEQGAMGYVPGSHEHGGLDVVSLSSAPGHGILEDPALVGGPGPVFVEAAAGSVVWHHGDTVHLAMGSSPEADTRKVFTIVYIADGYERADRRPCFPLDRAGVEEGALMEGDGLPLAWPRCASTLFFPLKNHDFPLKDVDFVIKKGGGRGAAATTGAHWRWDRAANAGRSHCVFQIKWPLVWPPFHQKQVALEGMLAEKSASLNWQRGTAITRGGGMGSYVFTRLFSLNCEVM